MQSRLAATATTSLGRVVFSAPRNQFLRHTLAYATSSGRPADPSVHAVDEEEIDYTEGVREAKLRDLENRTDKEQTKGNDPYVRPKSPIDSSPKVESTGVNAKIDPIAQQKRHNSTSTPIENVSCAGLDGSPWPDERQTERRQQREEQSRDDKEYFKDHKASPLSEIELADTRKPITRATDGTADSSSGGYFGGDNVLLFKPEQLDSAEDSLRRAMEMFRENAMRGDPDSPHGRVLRRMRGEFW